VGESRERSVVIGCASAFWGDTPEATRQFLHCERLDYLVYDFLSEVTMGLLALSKKKNPNAGFIPDFISALKPCLAELAQKKTRIISNAGGLNPFGCAAALGELCEEMDLDLKIAVVCGDNLVGQAAELKLPDSSRAISSHVYLGVQGIRRALEMGAQIVITGRVVDSALISAPLAHEFSWGAGDYDKLAQASLAGHILECGSQCTGGNFTDWESVEGFENMGFPLVEFSANGSFLVSKAPHTGGRVDVATVAEQIVYEIGDPSRYYLPDVVCDFTPVQLKQIGENQVSVQGSRGLGAPPSLKVCSTIIDGYRAQALLSVIGPRSLDKAKLIADAIIKRVNSLLRERDLEEIKEFIYEPLGCESIYGPKASHEALGSREVLLRIIVAHKNRDVLKIFSGEIAPAATSMAPGITNLLGGRPSISPRLKLVSHLLNRDCVSWETIEWTHDLKHSVPLSGERGDSEIIQQLKPFPDEEFCVQASGTPSRIYAPVKFPAVTQTRSLESDPEGEVVPLEAIAFARSGDKGEHCNIGVIARGQEFFPLIKSQLTARAVYEWFSQIFDGEEGRVIQYDWPGLNALNFVLEYSLGGGGLSSLRIDPQGKSYAQQLLEFPVKIPGDKYSEFQNLGLFASKYE
jgi:hypothetical protein